MSWSRVREKGTLKQDILEWLRRLVAGLSPRRPGFAPALVRFRFVLDKVIPGQVFL
jgi:hypothetical protein